MTPEEKLDAAIARAEQAQKEKGLTMSDAERLQCVRHQIEGLLEKVQDFAPKLVRKLCKRIVTGESVGEEVEQMFALAELRWPGITSMVEIAIRKYAELSKKVPGASEDGGLS